MKFFVAKVFGNASMLAAVAAGLNAHAEPTFLNDGLICYFPFLGNAVDSSTNGLVALATNLTFVPDRFSAPVSAAGFDGLTSSILIPHSQLPPIHPERGLTLSAWVLSVNGSQAPVMEFSNGQSAGVHFWINTPYTGRLFENLVDNTGHDHFYYTPASPLVPGRFQHIFSIYDYSSGQLSLYVDGTLVGTTPGGQIPFDTSEDLLIGFRYLGYNSAHFSGAIDEVRIYNRVFRDDEIQALHLRENTKSRSGLPFAVAQVVNGFVVAAVVADGGGVYTGIPRVAFVGGGGNGALGHVTLTNGTIASIVIDNAGSGYATVPKVVIDPPPPSSQRAVALAAAANGAVIGITPALGGSGYTTPPTIRLVGGGGSGATAFALVRDGEVVGIQITNPGTGYTNAPGVFIARPPQAASLAISVSRVAVTLSVSIGVRYRIESSSDLVTWTPAAPEFVPDSETVVREFDATQTGQYFRVVEVP